MATASFKTSILKLRVDFTDESTGASSWLWKFGDGTKSTEQNPVHTYYHAGTFKVTLTVTGTPNDTVSKEITVVGSRDGTALNPVGVHGEHTHVGGLVGNLKSQLPFFTRRKPNWY